MFNSINLQKLRNAEFLQFMRNIHALVHEYDLLTLAVLLTTLDAKIKDFDVKFKSSLKHPFTAEITKWDNNRDSSFRAIVLISEAYALHFNPTIAAEASALLEVIKNHGSNITRLNHQEETAVLISLINEIEASESLSASISSLNLSSFFDRLKNCNSKCEELLINRTESKADDESLSSKEQRQSIRVIYSELLQTIDAHIILNSEGDYQNMKGRINTLINEFKATSNLRG